MAEGAPLEREEVVNSGTRVQIPPSPFETTPKTFFEKVKKVVDKHK